MKKRRIWKRRRDGVRQRYTVGRKQRKRNPMNTRSNPQLLFGHSLLHSWAKDNFRNKPGNWSRADIISEHSRLVNIMKQRGFNHDSPITGHKRKRKSYNFFWKKNKDRYLSVSDKEYIDQATYNDPRYKQTYGEVQRISGRRLGAGIAASGVAVPLLIPIPLSAAIGAGVANKVDNIKLIKTDDQDRPYKIPRMNIELRKKKKNYGMGYYMHPKTKRTIEKFPIKKEPLPHHVLLSPSKDILLVTVTGFKKNLPEKKRISVEDITSKQQKRWKDKSQAYIRKQFEQDLSSEMCGQGFKYNKTVGPEELSIKPLFRIKRKYIGVNL